MFFAQINPLDEEPVLDAGHHFARLSLIITGEYYYPIPFSNPF